MHGIQTLPVIGTTDENADRAPDWVGTYPQLSDLEQKLNGHEIENATRKRLMEIIKERPGLNVQELADAAGLERDTARHHIDRLVDAGYVVTNRQGRHRLHFPAHMDEDLREPLSLLRIPSVRAVVEELYRRPEDISENDLAERLDLTDRTVRRAVRSLEDRDLLYLEQDGDTRKAHLHPTLRLVLARWLIGSD